MRKGEWGEKRGGGETVESRREKVAGSIIFRPGEDEKNQTFDFQFGGPSRC